MTLLAANILTGSLRKAIVVFSLLLSTVLAANACAQQTPVQAAVTEFQKFWSEFRSAVLAGDNAKVASMTRFPFTTRGTYDSDPVVSHDKNSFLKLWIKLLAQDSGLSAEPDTVQHMIEKKITITSKDIMVNENARSARVGDLVFTRSKGEWLMTHAYLNSD